jgi:nucleotide-binding universal stress UspA family protein
MNHAETQPGPGGPERPGRGRPPRPGLARPGPGRPDPARPDPGRPDPGRPRPARPSPAKPARAAQARPARPAPGPDPDPLSRPEPARDISHPVVAGYDGSRSSRNALAYAAGMARRLGRSLLLVYVVPGICCEPLTGQVIGATRDDAEMTAWLMAELDQVFDRDDLTVSVLIRRGNPARELAATADEASADALVVGAPGHLWHHVAGSVPGWLARHARCPVIVVP